MRVVSVFLFLLAGCDLSTTYACDLREADGGDFECQEYQLLGPDIPVVSGVCTSVGGDWSRGECPREGIVGGCEDVDPSNPWDKIRWIYADEDTQTQEDAAEDCDEEIEVPVPPPA